MLLDRLSQHEADRRGGYERDRQSGGEVDRLSPAENQTSQPLGQEGSVVKHHGQNGAELDDDVEGLGPLALGAEK